MPSKHPALYDTGYPHVAADPDVPLELQGHFVAEGWEDFDRGICPCGEVVRWDEEARRWTPDRTMRVVILTSKDLVPGPFGITPLTDEALRQVEMQDEIEAMQEAEDMEKAEWFAAQKT